MTANSFLPKVQVIKKSEKPSIKINIPEKNPQQTYAWTLEKENGSRDSGKFIASAPEFNLPLNIETGCHTLKINDHEGNSQETKLFVVPEKCYIPDAVLKNKKIYGPKIHFHNVNLKNDSRTADSKDLKNLIRKLSLYGAGIVGIGNVNPVLSLNIDEIERFIDDKELKIKLLSAEFQEQSQKAEKFKLLYHSFKEFHINNNTPKAEYFFNYVRQKGDCLKKPALFSALRDFLSADDAKYIDWKNWPAAYQSPHNEAVLQFENANSELIEFYMFLQWQADLQFGSAGRTSLEKKLDVGICVDLPLCAAPDSAETWINSNKYNYLYLFEFIKHNMIHAGAIKLLNIDEYINTDVLGIIALESTRNNCMVIVNMDDLSDEEKNLLSSFNIYDEKQFNFTEIFDESQLKEYFESLKDNFKDYDESLHITKIPDSTYRIQFNRDFTFNKAKEIIHYLKRLGISHVYASPLLSPRQGSRHGYDIVNHNLINQEAGTLDEFNSFVDELHHHGIGLILDIVPNHMYIGKENKWWTDILENGQASEFSHYFDIEWNPIKKEMTGKVLVPVLGDHYGNILSSGQFNFKFNEETGKFSLFYYDLEFPLNPSSYPTILEYRIDVLAARLGTSNRDYLEYLSILTIFKNLPKHTETEYEKARERIREKDIAYERLKNLCRQNYIVKGFIEENLIDFKCSQDNPISIDRVHNLLEEQVYRLAYWRVSVDEINYRRFFDINELAAVCVEKPDVFSNTHNFILDLIENKRIDGIRLDHTDGLLDPANYFKKLQYEISKKLDINFDTNETNLLCSEKLPFYITAEKILAPFEKIPPNWAIHGTVGYEFLNSVNGLFVNKNNEKKLTEIYHKFIEKIINNEEMVLKCKKLIMLTSLTGELNVLSNKLNQIAELYYYYRDYTLNSIRNALIEVISCFPVYRTYISAEGDTTKCGDYIKWAVGLAKKRSFATDASIFDFIEKVLLLELEPDVNSPRYEKILEFVLKFQQYTGPLMAKGFEDTYFYRYNRLISLNEVGGEPSRFGISVDEFHQHNLKRMQTTPNSLLNTSSHDSKRSEDLRARISAISEIPEEWQKTVKKWGSFNKKKKIDKNDEYLFYQTLVGIWTFDEFNEENRQNLIQRLENYILKAARESKVHTSWVNINSEYEQEICGFIRKILNYPEKHPFWKEFIPFQKKIATRGCLNSLSQCVLKLTSPGIPDIYQGSEVFKFNLVDPDNRQPVDYAYNNSLFEKIQNIPEESEPDVLKLFFTSTTLNFRQKNLSLFRLGEYIPLETTGKKSENFVAFARLHEGTTSITIVLRLVNDLIFGDNILKISSEVLADTKILLPKSLRGFSWQDIYTKQNKNCSNNEFLASEVLNTLPISVLFGNMI